MTASPSLLAVLAHPDDESLACGGLLAWCAERGARVSLLCLTRGEHGPGGRPEDLGAKRALELEQAARVLGVRETTLLGYEDGMLPWLDATRLEAEIRDAIDRLRPEVVVTFDEDGLYGHPDHVAVHELTAAAVSAFGEAGPALFYVSMPRGAMRSLVDAGRARSVDTPTDSSHVGYVAPIAVVLGVGDPDAFGAMAPPPTLVLDVQRFAVTKLHALRCHRTQVAGTVVELLHDDDAEVVLGVEHYRRARVGAAGRTFVDEWAGNLADVPR